MESSTCSRNIDAYTRLDAYLKRISMADRMGLVSAVRGVGLGSNEVHHIKATPCGCHGCAWVDLLYAQVLAATLYRVGVL